VSIAYLNGSFRPLEETCISVMDRGFLFGDGVYEVIPVYGGRLFRLSRHLKRLQDSLDAVRIGNPLSTAEWEQVLTQLVNDNAGSDQTIYLQVTRGVAAKRDHAFPVGVQPTAFAMSTPATPVTNAATETGIRVVTLPDDRWKHCNIKAITLLPNVLLRQQAVDAGSAEAILVRDGFATEGAASNIFIVTKGLLITPPNGPALLPGITRDLILELAGANAIPFQEVYISTAELAAADEVWLTSSTREISPVTRIDDRTIADGRPGPLWRKMIGLYQDYKDAVRRGEAG